MSISSSNRLFRTLLLKRLSALRHGCLNVVDGNSRVRIGDLSSDIQIELLVKRPRFYRRVLLGGGIGAAASLIDGDWNCDDLTALIQVFIRDIEVSDRLQRVWGAPLTALSRLRSLLRRNTPHQSRRNIHAHYDLGNAFFGLFLDPTMNYSSGIFPKRDATMQQASIEKMRIACETLKLHPGDHLLEIGTGWGALAEFAASEYGCQVTTATISSEQYKYAAQRVQEAGLGDRVHVTYQDYRLLTGKFSKIVSVEMIEAVGYEYYDQFFNQVSSLLTADGAALLQAIVIKDSRFEAHKKSVDFIREYIFPGGCLPSISALLQSASKAGNLNLLHSFDFANDYAETLRRWRSSFYERLDRVRAMGFGEDFIRMWLYYLCYCEAAFEERQINVVQMLLGKRGCSLGGLAARQSVSALAAK